MRFVYNLKGTPKRRAGMQSSVNLRQLEAFRAVILCGGMTAAGEMLGVTQPAVSRLIRDLETDLDLVLFERKGTRISPTDAALMLYRDVESFFQGGERIREAATAIRNLSTGNLRIGAMPTISLGYLAGVVNEFLADRPGISIVIHEDSSINVIDKVARHIVDLGLAFVGSEDPAVLTEALPIPEAVCVLPLDHPLAASESIDARDLENEDLILLGHNSLLRHNIVNAFRSVGVKPKVRIETRYAATACTFVAQGLGVAVVDPFIPLEIGRRRLVSRRFSPAVPYEFSLVFPVHRSVSGLAAEFGRLVHEHMGRDFPNGAGPDRPAQSL